MIASNDAYNAKERVGHMYHDRTRGPTRLCECVRDLRIHRIRGIELGFEAGFVDSKLDSWIRRWIRNWIPIDSVRDSKRVGPLAIVNTEISNFAKNNYILIIPPVFTLNICPKNIRYRT